MEKSKRDRKACSLGEAEVQEGLYAGSSDLYKEDYSSEAIQIQDSGKLRVLGSLLESFHRRTPTEKIVLVSNYTQVRHDS